MKTLIDVSVPILTLTMLFAVGLDLTSQDFARIRRQWAVVSAGLIGPLLLLPPIALLLIWIFKPAPEVSASLLLIAACPIGGISNTYSYLARASPALSVTLTGVSCLLAGVTMPVIGRALETAAHRAIDLSVPMSALIGQLFLMLTVPVGAGMLVRHVWPAFAERHHRSMQRLALFGVATVLALIIADNPQAFAHALPGTVPLAAVFVVCSTAAGWLTAAAVTADPRDRFTIAAEFGTRNLGVAMAIAVTMLGRLEFARFAYIYFLSEMLMMLAAIAVFRRLRPLGGAPTGRSAGLAFARETERPGEAHHLL